MIGRFVSRLAIIVVLASSGCVSRPSVQIKPFDRASGEPGATVDYADFWDAMARWDVSYVRNHSVRDEQRRYAEALDTLDRGEVDRGLVIARELHEKASDATVRKNARKLFNTVSAGRWRWDQMILPEPNEPMSESDAIARGFSEQMRRLPRQTHEFGAAVVQVQAEKRNGLLFLPVQINGQTHSLALDTGADGTVLADDVAGRCGVELVPNYTCKGRTLNGYVTSRLGRVDRLTVGGLTIRSHPVLVDPKQDMLTPRFQIDGVLGSMAIRAMDIEIDYSTLVVTIRKPEPRKDMTANLLPTHHLILRVRTPTGIPALMTFDTGCGRTLLYGESLPYLGLTPRGHVRHNIVTFGSQKSMLSGRIRDLDLVLGSWQAHWTYVVAGPDLYDEPMPVNPMGILGSDIFRDGGHVRIDWSNRRVDFGWDTIDQGKTGL